MNKGLMKSIYLFYKAGCFFKNWFVIYIQIPKSFDKLKNVSHEIPIFISINCVLYSLKKLCMSKVIFIYK